jgi:hypothetical protein
MYELFPPRHPPTTMKTNVFMKVAITLKLFHCSFISIMQGNTNLSIITRTNC